MNQNHYKRIWIYPVVGHEKILKSEKASQDENTIICTDLFANKYSRKKEESELAFKKLLFNSTWTNPFVPKAIKIPYYRHFFSKI